MATRCRISPLVWTPYTQLKVWMITCVILRRDSYWQGKQLWLLVDGGERGRGSVSLLRSRVCLRTTWGNHVSKHATDKWTRTSNAEFGLFWILESGTKNEMFFFKLQQAMTCREKACDCSFLFRFAQVSKRLEQNPAKSNKHCACFKINVKGTLLRDGGVKHVWGFPCPWILFWTKLYQTCCCCLDKGVHYRGVTARTKIASLPPHLGDLVGAVSSVNHKGLHQGCHLLGDNTWEYGGGDKASFFVFCFFKLC